ncbi:MAG TPA: MFS transporter, partial [Chloroflexota bacterium]
PSVGAFVGTLVILSVGDIRYKGWWIVGSILTYCVCLIGLALSPWFTTTWLLAAGLGFTDRMQATPRNAVIQLLTPDELRGRVTAFRGMLAGGGPSLGQASIGAAATVVGAPVALVVGALACIAVNLGIMARDSELRSRDLGMEPEPVAP